MRTTFTTLFILFFLSSNCQTDTTYFFNLNGKVVTKSNKIYKQVLEIKENKKYEINTFLYKENIWKRSYNETITRKSESTEIIKFEKDGLKIKLVRTYTKLDDGTWDFIEEYNGSKKREGRCSSKIPFLLHGKVLNFFANGNIMSESIYEENVLISNKNWLENGEKYFDNIFYSVDSYPYYELGNQVLNNHILAAFEKKGIDYSEIIGKLIIGFVVLEDGTIDGFKVIKGIHSDFDNSVIEAFESLTGVWKPAKLNGENVRYLQMFPINFKKENHELDPVDYATNMAVYYRY